MVKYMSDEVMNAITNMIIGSLRYYAGNGLADEREAEMLSALADHIEDGTADEVEWLEAIAQIDMSE